MIISSGHCRRKQARSQGKAQTWPVCGVGCFFLTIKSPENKGKNHRTDCIALKLEKERKHKIHWQVIQEDLSATFPVILIYYTHH